MIIALAQTNPVVGDIALNCRRIGEWIKRAGKAGAELVVFPELTVTGYPPKDLLRKAGFVQDNVRAIESIAKLTAGGPAALVGFVQPNASAVGRSLWNATALLRNGRLDGEFHKSLLPTRSEEHTSELQSH